MPEHFTKSTVQASIWCNRCNKQTPWRIHDGRRQYCIPCYELGRIKKPPKPAEETQPTLFPVAPRN